MLSPFPCNLIRFRQQVPPKCPNKLTTHHSIANQMNIIRAKHVVKILKLKTLRIICVRR